jgi:molecular chaperone DnaK
MADLKEAVKGDDVGAIQAKTQTLAQASMKLGEAMYAQKPGETPPGPDGGAAGGTEAKKEDVVDAEFTEVDDDKRNKKSA